MSDKPGMSLAVVGPKGCGKTTALAKLCASLNGFQEDLHADCRSLAKDLGRPAAQHGWMLDKLPAERESGMTVESSFQTFQTDAFQYTAIDSPGNDDFVANFLSITSLADIAVLVVSAAVGEYEEGINSGRSRELALGCFTMGIKNVVVLVTKMDDPSVAYSAERFELIKKDVSAYLKEVGYKQKEVPFIPISGIDGDNLASRSAPMSWYASALASEALDAQGPINRPPEKPLRLPILKVHSGSSSSDSVVVVGRVETGTLRTGIKLIFSPSGLVGEVQSLQKDGESISEAQGGDIVGVCLGGDVASVRNGLRRGMVASQSSNDPVADAETFLAQVVVLEHPGSIRNGYSPSIAIHTAQVACEFEELLAKIDRKTGKESEQKPETLKSGEVAMVRMRPKGQVCVETFSAYPPLGRFAIRDHGKTVAVGVVKEVTKKPIATPRIPGENEYFDN